MRYQPSKTLREYIATFRQYRRHHSATYAASIAAGVAPMASRSDPASAHPTKQHTQRTRKQK